MDKKTMLQVLLPAGTAAAVVLLIGVLIAVGDKPAEKSGGGTAAGSAPVDEEGMTNTLPPLDSPEWKPGTGGMKVWEVAEGAGDPCPAGATVTIHYTGWTKDGKVFDSSRAKLAPRGGGGTPATYPLGKLIAGWQEGIPGMKPGGIRRLLIPYQKAYGEQGGNGIPPRADLVFEIKLFKF